MKHLLNNNPIIVKGRKSVIFLPGLFFILMALAVIVAPRFVLGILAGLLLFVGFTLCLIAWKFLQLRDKFATVTKTFGGKVQFQGFQIRDAADFDDLDSDEKKIIFH